MQNFKSYLLKENNFQGDIHVPTYWTDLSGLSELYPGYIPGCNLTGYFTAYECTKLISIKDGCPNYVSGHFSLASCHSLLSLEGAPLITFGFVGCDNCWALTSLKGLGKQYLKKIKGSFDLDGCLNLKSNILGLCLVEGISYIYFNSNKEVENIMNDNINDVLDCQEELITKGFKEYAKL